MNTEFALNIQRVVVDDICKALMDMSIIEKDPAGSKALSSASLVIKYLYRELYQTDK
jgi:hypothetical protein